MSNYNYADGAIHNDHHKEMTINVSGKTDIAALMKAFMADDAEEAENLFEKLREASMVDARMQPLNLSNAEKGMLAFELAGRLNIQNQWQVFATLWGTTPGALRSAYNRAIEQQKTMIFIEKIKSILN